MLPLASSAGAARDPGPASRGQVSVDRVVFGVPPEGRDKVLPILDKGAALMAVMGMTRPALRSLQEAAAPAVGLAPQPAHSSWPEVRSCVLSASPVFQGTEVRQVGAPKTYRLGPVLNRGIPTMNHL